MTKDNKLEAVKIVEVVHKQVNDTYCAAILVRLNEGKGLTFREDYQGVRFESMNKSSCPTHYRAELCTGVTVQRRQDKLEGE